MDGSSEEDEFFDAQEALSTSPGFQSPTAAESTKEEKVLGRKGDNAVPKAAIVEAKLEPMPDQPSPITNGEKEPELVTAGPAEQSELVVAAPVCDLRQNSPPTSDSREGSPAGVPVDQVDGVASKDVPDGSVASSGMVVGAAITETPRRQRMLPSTKSYRSQSRPRRSAPSLFSRMASSAKGGVSKSSSTSSAGTPGPPAVAVSTSGEPTRSESTATSSRYNDVATIEDGAHGNFNIAGSGIITGGTSAISSNGAGQQLTDAEILETVLVKNLDTGETIPLSEAEKCIPVGVNPLALHIMRLTSEYVGEDGDVHNDSQTSDGITQAAAAQAQAAAKHVKHKGKKAFKALRGKVKSLKSHLDSHGDDSAEVNPEPTDAVRFKASSSNRGPYEFDNFTLQQDLSKEHMGPVWTLQFSPDGRLLASAGQDLLVRVWVLRKARSCFDDLKTKYAREGQTEPSSTGAGRHQMDNDCLFEPQPFCVYSGHTSDILDLAWSKNYFLLSASFDKTVRLWHVSRQECLACFQHTEFVTGIAFHPRDDRYFLSGSLDSRLRLWNIPDKKVALWNEVEGPGNRLITAANFVQNGKYAVAGTYDGRCLLYETEYLKYHTQIRARSSRGKNAKGRKITGIVPMPGEDKILISSNDSRVRLYDLKDHSLVCKYKGASNRTSQIEASFSASGCHIISGSENGHVYLWRTYHDFSRAPPTTRRDLNDFYESFTAPASVQTSENHRITAAVFAPVPGLFAGEGIRDEPEVIVEADFDGGIRVYTKGVPASS